jgi:hypothetical protein
MNPALATAIAEFTPIDGVWLPLDKLFEEVFSSDDPAAYYTAIFTLFERFPNADGAGVFWSALHGMETRGSYEADLLRSFRRSPSEMTHTLLMRIRNSGESEISGVSIDTLIGPAART